ncbi:MAG: hypothetical protein RMJ28_07030 [Nitrososphaerota archaeon]|nr:hypothetical protein [Candidatus Calditenuaceae archaeon]MDW8073967.1 hypothetical protein [Nitrososphaerota archaeon]
MLVDDIITRGHTVLGGAWRIAEAYPNSIIVAFALFRTISEQRDFRKILEPVRGEVVYRPRFGDALRRP